MWTCLLVAAGKLPKLQLSTPPVREQPLSEPAASIDQVRPALAGNVSLTATPVAVPVPAALPLDTVITKPIEVPALTVPASAVLVILRTGHWTVMLIGPSELFDWVPPPSLVAEAEALLATGPQVSAVVGEVMWTCLLAPATRSPKLQASLPLLIVQPLSEPAALIDQLRPVLVGSVSLTVTPFAVPAPLSLDTVIT